MKRIPRCTTGTHTATRIARALAVGLALLLSATLSAAQQEPNPYAKPNNSWISISGTVKSVSANAFSLDYGKGMVRVEMDDHDRDADGYKLLEGDKVTVHGRIDDDFFEATKIEAGSVYVEKLDTFFYASADDEEDRYDAFVFSTPTTPIVLSSTVVQGTVTSVDAEEREFTLNTGKRSLKVDTKGLPYDPLDDEGYLRIDAGDVVRVTGRMDANLFAGRELVARSVVKLWL